MYQGFFYFVKSLCKPLTEPARGRGSKSEDALKEIDKISEKYNVTFVISTAVEESMLPAEYAANVVCKL